MMNMDVQQNGLSGGLFGLPWCCIVPAGFSLLSLGGVTAATTVLEGLAPLLLIIALFFLGRAHYLITVKKQGNRTSHVITWLSTLVTMTVWGLQWLS